MRGRQVAPQQQARHHSKRVRETVATRRRTTRSRWTLTANSPQPPPTPATGESHVPPLVNLAIVASAISSPNLPDGEKLDLNEISLHVVEASVIEKINDQRERHGRSPLEIDFALMQSSRKHCSWMTRSNRLQHTSAPVAENIAMGQRNASEAVRSWMNSSGHRANILILEVTGGWAPRPMSPRVGRSTGVCNLNEPPRRGITPLGVSRRPNRPPRRQTLATGADLPDRRRQCPGSRSLGASRWSVTRGDRPLRRR